MFRSIVFAVLLLGVVSPASAALITTPIIGIDCGAGIGFWPQSKGANCPPPPEPDETNKSGAIAFKSMESGTSNDNGDGTGSGDIVTFWLYAPVPQGASTVRYIDSFNQAHNANVYYWKNADGTLPGGPSNLFQTHGLQEVAVGVPTGTPEGDGQFCFTISGLESCTNFRVENSITQFIYVASDGDNSGAGTWADPWQTIGFAVDNAPTGSSIYIKDVNAGFSTLTEGGGGEMSERGIFQASGSPPHTSVDPLVVQPYPGYQPTVWGEYAVEAYQKTSLWILKLRIRSGNKRLNANGQPGSDVANGGKTWGQKGTAYGASIGNDYSDADYACSSRFHGAVVAGADTGFDYTSAFRLLGAHIENHGCYGSNKLHHTTYFSIRSPDNQLVDPILVAWNALIDNPAKNGVHAHDQGNGCGQYTGRVIFANNVVVNQGGAGITWQTSGCERYDEVTIANNLMMNVGLAAAWDGINPLSSDGHDGNCITVWDSGQRGTITVQGNTCIGWNRDHIDSASACFGFRGSQDYVRVDYEGNACIAVYDERFVASGFQSDDLPNNVFDNGVPNAWVYLGGSGYTRPSFFADADYPGYPGYSEPDTPALAVQPTWPNLTATDVTTDPQYTHVGYRLEIAPGSPLKSQVPAGPLAADLYRSDRNPTSTIGAVE